MLILSETQKARIQMVRGLCILAVIGIHLLPEGSPMIIIRPFLNPSVSVFLFLSGFLSDGERGILFHRIKKVMIPYIIWTAAYTFLYFRRFDFRFIGSYLGYLVRADASAAMYFIFVYCEFVLLLPVIDRMAKSRYRYLVFLISPLEILIMRILPIISGLDPGAGMEWIQNISCLPFFGCFYLGYLLGHDWIRIPTSNACLTGIWIVSAGMEMLAGVWYRQQGFWNYGTQRKLTAICTSMIVCVMVFRFITSESKRVNVPLKRLGDYSFGIFFLHWPVIFLLTYFHNFWKYLYFPLNAMLTAILSYFLAAGMKKILGKYSGLLGL